MEQFISSSGNSLARYRDYLRSLARAWLGRRSAAEVDASDIVQEALLKAHRARDQFRGRTERELAAWLKTILNNTLANALRSCVRQKVEASVSSSSPQDSSAECPGWLPADGQPRPEEVASLNEQLLRLARALGRLPDDQRGVVELKHLHGLSIAEICERTGRSKASIVGLLFRGVKALRALMDVPEQETGGLSP